MSMESRLHLDSFGEVLTLASEGAKQVSKVLDKGTDDAACATPPASIVCRMADDGPTTTTSATATATTAPAAGTNAADSPRSDSDTSSSSADYYGEDAHDPLDLAALTAAAVVDGGASALLMFEDPAAIAQRDSLPPARRRSILRAMFLRACSNGDVGRVKDLLDLCQLRPAGRAGLGDDDAVGAEAGEEGGASCGLHREDLVCAADDDGTTGLIYAACWGHADVIEMLLDAGASIDQKDNSAFYGIYFGQADLIVNLTEGWTALVWACSNGHELAARTLVGCRMS
ncbi:hypothetical protein HK405_005124 [Cladochytrium tenue]|nr:hypothetical protein HK405_005124 [Cladochytrium tenue]